MKPRLDKYETALLMVIKNHEINLSYAYDKDFKFSNKNKLLNNYKELAIVYADGRKIPLESVTINLLSNALLNIFEKCCLNNFKRLINKIIYKDSYNQNKNNEEVLLITLFEELQVLKIIENEKELFELDISLVKGDI